MCVRRGGAVGVGVGRRAPQLRRRGVGAAEHAQRGGGRERKVGVEQQPVRGEGARQPEHPRRVGGRGGGGGEREVVEVEAGVQRVALGGETEQQPAELERGARAAAPRDVVHVPAERLEEGAVGGLLPREARGAEPRLAQRVERGLAATAPGEGRARG